MIRLMCTERKIANREITEDTDSEILDLLVKSKGECFYFCREEGCGMQLRKTGLH